MGRKTREPDLFAVIAHRYGDDGWELLETQAFEVYDEDWLDSEIHSLVESGFTDIAVYPVHEQVRYPTVTREKKAVLVEDVTVEWE